MIKQVLYLFILMAVNTANTFANDTKQLYQRLDSLIAQQDNITREKELRIQIIKDGLKDRTLTAEQRYKINERLYDEYLAFKYDSAFKYVTENIVAQQDGGHDELLYRSRMQLAHILAVTGMFEKANEVLNSIETKKLEGALLAEYHTQRSELYLFQAEFANGTTYFKAYHDSAMKYRKLILNTAPHDSYTYIYNRASYNGELEYTGEAIGQLERYLRQLKEGERPYSIVSSTLAYLCSQRHMPEKQEYYLLLSAISDIKGAIRENNSLRELAQIQLEHGDLDRAFRYISVSSRDAVFYGTRLRNMQAAKLAPQIARLYTEERARQQQRTMWMLIGISLVAVMLVIGIAIIWTLLKKRRAANKKIHIMNAQLSAVNAQLSTMNTQMKESNKIKDEYLGRLLELCSAYIDRADEQRKLENRLARDHKLPELYAELKSTRYINDATHLFYQTFDTAFLNIYPKFVDHVNQLLLPEHRITPDSEKLTTELRILALLRLGISDNQKIAAILRSSITTIYTYRSKLKAKALEKETFEDAIKQIESY